LYRFGASVTPSEIARVHHLTPAFYVFKPEPESDPDSKPKVEVEVDVSDAVEDPVEDPVEQRRREQEKVSNPQAEP